MTCLVFRIRKRYFDAIVSGEKKVEFRRASPFWRKRIEGKNPSCKSCQMTKTSLIDTAVFVCGKRVHRRQVVDIQEIPTPSYFSDQGKQDVDTPTCFAITLGLEVVKCPSCESNVLRKDIKSFAETDADESGVYVIYVQRCPLCLDEIDHKFGYPTTADEPLRHED